MSTLSILHGYLEFWNRYVFFFFVNKPLCIFILYFYVPIFWKFILHIRNENSFWFYAPTRMFYLRRFARSSYMEKTTTLKLNLLLLRALILKISQVISWKKQQKKYKRAKKKEIIYCLKYSNLFWKKIFYTLIFKWTIFLNINICCEKSTRLSHNDNNLFCQ